MAIGFVVVVSLAAFIASNMVTPIYTVVLRCVYFVVFFLK